MGFFSNLQLLFSYDDHNNGSSFLFQDPNGAVKYYTQHTKLHSTKSGSVRVASQGQYSLRYWVNSSGVARHQAQMSQRCVCLTSMTCLIFTSNVVLTLTSSKNSLMQDITEKPDELTHYSPEQTTKVMIALGTIAYSRIMQT